MKLVVVNIPFVNFLMHIAAVILKLFRFFEIYILLGLLKHYIEFIIFLCFISFHLWFLLVIKFMFIIMSGIMKEEVLNFNCQLANERIIYHTLFHKL